MKIAKFGRYLPWLFIAFGIIFQGSFGAKSTLYWVGNIFIGIGLLVPGIFMIINPVEGLNWIIVVGKGAKIRNRGWGSLNGNEKHLYIQWLSSIFCLVA